MDDSRLKLAVQKSGRLTDPSMDLLLRCGLKISRGKDQLMAYGENMPLDVLFVRDDDIPDLVQEDVCDLGLVGLNVLEEKRLELAAQGARARFQQIRTLDFGRCRLSLAVPEGVSYEGPSSLRGKRIATTYPYMLANYLRENNIIPEKNDLNAILFLMTPAEDESKLNTLIAKLAKFKSLWDRDAALAEVLPTLSAAQRERYAGYTLRLARRALARGGRQGAGAHPRICADRAGRGAGARRQRKRSLAGAEG